MIGIIGAGISGLSLAWNLKQLNIPFILWDENPGGVIHSEKKEGYLLENGPNSLILSPELERLIQETGFSTSVIYPNVVAKKRYVLFKNRPTALPSGPISLLGSPLFSWNSIFALWKERNLSSKSPENETVADFFDRRFSPEIRKNLVDPFVSGIYAGDPEKMLMSLSFPKLLEMEKKYGSVIRGFMKSKTKQQTINFIHGVHSFIEHLIAQIPELVREKVQHIQKTESGWLVNEKTPIKHLVMCTPAFISATLLQSIYPTIAESLSKVYYPSVIQAYIAFPESAIQLKTPGFGLLSPTFEKSFCLGTLFSSQLFTNRAPQGMQLFTAFIGGSRNPEYTSISNEEIIQKTTQELQDIFSIQAQPVFSYVKRYSYAIPQPDKAMKIAREQVQTLDPTLSWAGNWLSGVAVSDCIQFSYALAQELRTKA